MSIGNIVDLIITVLIGALISTIGFLLRGRFIRMENDLETIQATQHAQALALTSVTEAVKAMSQNQTSISRSQEKLIMDADDLDDITDQLQDATRRIYERQQAHDEMHQRMLDNRLGG